jgi:hypothetical protein
MPTAKRMGRPPKKEQKMTERIIALFTADERDRLMKIVDEKRLSISVIVREAIQQVYPQVFKEQK